MYTLKLHVDGKVLTQQVEVRMDPRVKTSKSELEEAHKLALQLREEITTLSNTVIALKSVRTQIKRRSKALEGDKKAEAWTKQAKEVVTKLDALEEQLHNPKAKVEYDILARKGGAKLYSQITPLYYTVMDADGPVTQGMREVYADNAKELARLEAIWRGLVANEISELNKSGNVIVVPSK
jgi:hypothetical protein